MKKLFGALLMTFAMNAVAMDMPSYENLEQVLFPQTQDYAEALSLSISNRPVGCTLNGKRLPISEVRTIFSVTIGERLNLISDESVDLSKLYLLEGNNPAFLITTSHEKAQEKLYDELRFNLTENSKSVTSIEFDQYVVKIIKANEGTLRNPVMVTKEIIAPKLNIRCKF